MAVGQKPTARCNMPRYPLNLPGEVEPGKKWTGIIRQRPDVIPNLYTGNFYAGVFTTARDKPYLIRISQKKSQLPEGTKKL